MVKFRRFVGDDPVAKWQTLGDNAIAFSRGSKGFIVIVNDDVCLDQYVNTGLSSGDYCDIISGDLINNEQRCSGRVIKVENDGKARVAINGSSDEDPMIAIYGDAKLN